MNAGSISNAYRSFSTQTAQRMPEAAEMQKGGGDNDGDADDRGAAAVQSTPSPTVNTSGQQIGRLINVTA
jgi:hypothetical protein